LLAVLWNKIDEAIVVIEKELKDIKKVVEFLETQPLWGKIISYSAPDIFDNVEDLSINIKEETLRLIQLHNLF